MAELNRSTTSRGFIVYDEFTDTCGNLVRVGSSAAAKSRCWIFAGPSPDMIAPPQLDVEQAKRVRAALDAFINEHGDENDG